jgi:hypothetical protein
MEALETELRVNKANDGISLTTICPLAMNTGMFKSPKSRSDCRSIIKINNYSMSSFLFDLNCKYCKYCLIYAIDFRGFFLLLTRNTALKRQLMLY